MFISFMAAHKDRVGKYWGVPDLVVDTKARTLEVLRLKAHTASYESTATLSGSNVLPSPTLPGFSLALAELFPAE